MRIDQWKKILRGCWSQKNSQAHNRFRQKPNGMMRTTLNIDSDVLLAIREIAKRQSRPAGAVVSDLLRQALTGTDPSGAEESMEQPTAEFGFLPFRKRGGHLVTNELIDRLRGEDCD